MVHLTTALEPGSGVAGAGAGAAGPDCGRARYSCT